VNPVLALLLRVPLHGIGLFVTFLPRPVELLLGRLLGKLFLALDWKRRSIGRENMRRCLPELDDAALERLLAANYAHYGVLFFELCHMYSPVPGHWRRYAAANSRCEGLEHVRGALEAGKGFIVYGGHSANWELGSAAGGLAGIHPMIVTRRLKPAWLHDWMENKRLETGVACAFQPRTMPSILKQLKRGHGVGFVLDQYMPPPMGEPMRFFGATVHTLAAVAPLARRTGAAVIRADNLREADGTIRVRFMPPEPLATDDKSANQRYIDLLEADIRRAPEQWLWIHRRFKDAVWPSSSPPKTAARS
jgi:KDO2-lipid IV(A) lauroyltransferase